MIVTRSLVSRRNLGIFGGAALGLFLLSQFQQRKKKAAAAAAALARQRDKERSATSDASKNRGRSQAVNKIIKFLLAKVGKKHLILFALFAIAQTTLSNYFAFLQAEIFKKIFLRKKRSVLYLLFQDVAFSLLQSFLSSGVKYVATQLAVANRKSLVALLSENYFKGNVFYKLHEVDKTISNPEEILTADVAKISESLATIASSVMQAAVDTIFYTYRLGSFVGWRYPLVMYAYVAVGGIGVSAIAPNFGKIFAALAEKEGDYRFAHTRLLRNHEGVALLHGGERESTLLSSRFASVVKQQLANIHTQWGFNIVRDFVLKYMGATVAVYVILGPFFQHGRANFGEVGRQQLLLQQAQMLSDMRYVVSVVISNFGGLGSLAIASRELNMLSAHAHRVLSMADKLKELASAEQSESKNRFFESDDVEFKNCMIQTPTGEVLAKDVTFKVLRGQSVLITGANGAGKSSLFRLLGGLWPLHEGSIGKPSNKNSSSSSASGLSQSVFYVPQRPYVSVGTLAEQISYPLTSDEAAALGQAVSQDSIVALLQRVDLEYLCVRHGWNERVDWEAELSLGEQQRLGMARLFYHSPAFAVLDECTSAVTVAMEHRFYESVKAANITCITISHRPALIKFHDAMFSLNGTGGWSFSKIQAGGEEEELEEEGVEASTPDQAPAHSESHHHQLIASSPPVAASGSSSLHFAPPASPTASAAAAVSENDSAKSSQSLLSRFGKDLLALPLCRRIIPVLVPHLRSFEAGLLAAVGGVVVARVALSERIAMLNGNSVLLMLNNDQAGFVRLLFVSLVQSVFSALSAPTLSFLTARLALCWRERLTRAVTRLYMKDSNFYFVAGEKSLDDPDSRLTKDIEKLSSELANLIPTAIKPLVDIAWFSWRMHSLLGFKGLVLLSMFLGVGFGLLRIVNPNNAMMAEREAVEESRFRFLHSRLRAHTESIAFFGGGHREHALISEQFDRLISTLSSHSLRRALPFAISDFVTKQLPPLVSWATSLMYALSISIDPSHSGEFSRNLRYLASVVSHVFLAVGELIELGQVGGEILGLARRVGLLWRMLEEVEAKKQQQLDYSVHRVEGGDQVVVRDADIVTPHGKCVARKLNLQVLSKQNLLISGPNGSGKTSIVRVLANLWPPASGGQVEVPADVFFVPQKPYTSLGTLRDQVIYPMSVEQARRLHSDLDAKIVSLLATTNVAYLAERGQGLDHICDWSMVLSLGEQQRIGMARVFFRAPRFAVFDECTNAISVDMEESLYRQAISQGTTFITVTQRPALTALHSTSLQLIDSRGAWALRSLHVYSN